MNIWGNTVLLDGKVGRFFLHFQLPTSRDVITHLANVFTALCLNDKGLKQFTAYEPFDQLVDPDPQTRAALARVITATTGAGHNAYVTINNKAEGSTPRSVIALAERLARPQQPDAAGPVA